MKTAFITGITGQDGSYLAEFLLEKGYKIIGLASSKYNIGWDNIKHIKTRVVLRQGDLLDKSSLEKVFSLYKVNEVYNLAGITFLPACWEKPALSFDINALGVLRLLEIIRDKYPKIKFYQAGSAKIFGHPKISPQDEDTEILPVDPYSIAKASAYFMVNAFRNNYSLFLVNGILYNHESPRRGPDFVTKKITIGAAKIKLGLEKKLRLGDLSSVQDWGFAPDYVAAMWLMLQQDKPQDFVVATGKAHTVAQICEVAFKALGLDYKKYVVSDKILFRKQEGKPFVGNASKAKKILKWQPRVSFEEMIEEMVKKDYQKLKEVKNK